MLTSMSYSPQPELFARSLRRRLQSLTPDRSREQSSSPMEDEDGSDNAARTADSQPQAMVVPLPEEGEEERIRRILERGLNVHDGRIFKMQHSSFPLPGTTFPPNRFLNGDLVRAKFRSESDLFPAAENKSLDSGGMENDSENASVLTTDVTNDVCDSDLFFDFDIGSPEPAEVEDVEHVINQNDGISLGMGKESPTNSEVSSNSPTLLDAPLRQSPSTTEPSTAYGSTSSGLFSDTEASCQTERDEDCAGSDFLEGISLHPDDWIKNQQSLCSSRLDKSSSVTPVVSPPSTQEKTEGLSPAAACESEPLALADDDVSSDETETKTETNNSDDSSDGQEVKVCVGETEKLVARCKLQALLAQFDKGKELLPSEPVSRQFASDPQLLSTSPANFSHLVGTAGVEGSPNNLSVKSNMARCQSSLDMSEYDKSSVRSRASRASSEVHVDQKSKKKSDKPKAASDDDEDDDSGKKEKYRRSSSLRSGKTPPGTPARRKIVRFADVFGLDLADVKTFLDEVPNVPKSAFRDLKDAELSDMDSDTGSDLTFPVLPPTGPPVTPSFRASSSGPTIAPLFNQPSGSSEFFNHLRDKKVCLESAYMSDLTTIKGIVRVVNLDYNKKIVILYTTDDWVTTSEAVGEYIVGSCDGFSDKFNIELDYSAISGMVGRRLQFCIKYECAGNDYWDNNFGKNYIFQCFGPSSKMSSLATKSTPIEAAARAIGSHGMTTFSHSPAMNDDPWLRYL